MNCDARGQFSEAAPETGAPRTHLEDFVAHLENDGVLHTVVLDEEVHVLRPSDVGKGPLDFALERLRHVLVKVLEEVDLALDVLRVNLDVVMPSRVDVALPVGDIVEMPAKDRGDQ